ncbi:MAG: YMGG-like glycine zipper-containing protein [Pseudomonadota bacterium]|nr:YMGG-like glycine zipper-containing protein [Pseudomonadota bacterium]
MKRLIAVVLVAFLAAGCATQGQQARTEGTAAGAGIGALIGAGLGAAFGGGRGAAIGAGVGALLGSIAGYSYADNIAKRRSDLAGKENDLDARIAFAHGVNEDTQKYNVQLASEINDSAVKVNTLAAQYKNQQITQQQLVTERQNMSKKVQDAENQLQIANEQLDDLKRFRSQQPGPSDTLDIEITRLEGQLAQLKTNTSTLASLSQRI